MMMMIMMMMTMKMVDMLRILVGLLVAGSTRFFEIKMMTIYDDDDDDDFDDG